MPHITRTFIFNEHKSQTLIDFLNQTLAREYAELSFNKDKIRTLCIAGLVAVNNRVQTRASTLLYFSDTVRISFKSEKIPKPKQANDINFELTENSILFEDEYLIAINKPALFPVEPTIVTERDNLFDSLNRFLRLRSRETESDLEKTVYTGMHHRLDHHTSGVILFSKNRSVNAELHALFEQHRIQKEYEALCYAPGGLYKKSTPVAGQSFSVTNQLARITPKSQQGKWASVTGGGDYAETAFSVLSRSNLYFHIAAYPKTGRTHQIRVHLSEFGMPLLGDTLYGGLSEVNGCPVPRTMLHAKSITFEHPVNAQMITISAPYPQDFIDTAKICNVTA